jgi:outer membrane protein assembly factor BamE (lipoprotein component of BamABCDE complex)
MKILHLSSLTLVYLLVGCSGLYTPPVQQGSAIAQTEIKKIKIGTHESDVVQKIGSPSFKHVLHSNQWYYVLDGDTSKTIITYKLVFNNKHELSRITSQHT